MLYYLHIPKTGGTSLLNFLLELYGPEKVFQIYYDINYKNAKRSRQILGKKELIYGHFCFSVHRLLHDNQAKYVTSFRHPVERLVSLYKHLKRCPDSDSYEIIKQHNWSLRDFIESRSAIDINNHMTRILSADYSRMERWIYFTKNWYSNARLKIPIYPFNQKRYLHTALSNLEKHFIFVGKTSNLDATKDFFSHIKNQATNSSKTLEKQNASPAQDQFTLDPATRRAIENANCLDLELYYQVMRDPERYHACFATSVRKFAAAF